MHPRERAALRIRGRVEDALDGVAHERIEWLGDARPLASSRYGSPLLAIDLVVVGAVPYEVEFALLLVPCVLWDKQLEGEHLRITVAFDPIG